MIPISFIVSTFDRPDELRHLLWALRTQRVGAKSTPPDFEVIVTDNQPKKDLAKINQAAVAEVFGETGARYIWTGDQPWCQRPTTSCYCSANYGAKFANGRYLCFPSDDDWYCPEFVWRMMMGFPAEFIYCDAVNKYIWNSPQTAWFHWVTYPKLGQIDKGGFLIAKALFDRLGGFPDLNSTTNGNDGKLADLVMKAKASTAKVPGILWAHA